MPPRGYRKGISDTKVPTPCSVRTHVSEREFRALATEAKLRGMTVSKFVRSVLHGHLTGSRAQIPHPKVSPEALLHLARAGNNLNQVARQANLMHLHLIHTKALAAIAAVDEAVGRLV